MLPSSREFYNHLDTGLRRASNGFCHRIAPTDSDLKNQFFLFNI
jgi:hypothetical protein